MSLEYQSRQSAQFPGTIVNRDVFRVPCYPSSTFKLGNCLVALVTADGIDAVSELPVYRFHRFNAHDSENDYGFTAVGLTTGKGSTPIFYKGKTFEPIDRKSLTSIYKKYYADPIGYLLQDAKYAAIVKIKDEKGNILKHSKRAEPYNPIER